jgi:hypothetical protein
VVYTAGAHELDVSCEALNFSAKERGALINLPFVLNVVVLAEQAALA